MLRREKLLLSFIVGCLVLFCGTTVEAVPTRQAIYKIAEDSTVHLGFTDAKGNRWTGSGFVVRDGQIVTNSSRCRQYVDWICEVDWKGGGIPY